MTMRQTHTERVRVFEIFDMNALRERVGVCVCVSVSLCVITMFCFQICSQAPFVQVCLQCLNLSPLTWQLAAVPLHIVVTCMF